MVVINAKFDGKNFVPEKTPQGLAPDTRVRIIVEQPDRSLTLATLAAMAKPGGFPPDYAAQHEHYTKGLPRK